MGEFKAILQERVPRTPTVESFRFLPDKKISFIPGQFLQLIFDPRYRDNKELNKYLSFSSSPHWEYIEVTKRLSSSEFSAKLRTLKSGDEVLLKAPLGNCTFRPEYKKIGFLIGGIGITPVISIIEYITGRKLDTDVTLVYSNRTDEEIAFKPQLDAWKLQNRNLAVYYLVSDYQPKDKNCLYGTINKDLLREKVGDLEARTVFIFGPPLMVEAMVNLSSELGCIKENLKTESFIGY